MSGSTVYDQRYSGHYREKVSGYEIARERALEHLIGRVLGLSGAGRVLDYGAGSGMHTQLLERIFPKAELYACEISAVAMEKFRERFPQHAERCAAVTDNRADLADGMFDVIVSIEVMEHVEDLDAYLGDILRLLRPGGTFIWTTPCGNALSVEHVYSTVTRQIDPTPEGYRRWRWEDPTHVRRLKTREIADRLKRVGFAEVDFRFRAHVFSFLCTQVLRRRKTRLRNWLMTLDYTLFRRLPNGASMIGAAKKAG